MNEQLCFSIFLISGGRDTDPTVAGKAAFVFFSSGWLVRNLRAQGGEDMAAAAAVDMSVTGHAATP